MNSIDTKITSKAGLVIGIDASNLRRGGGQTHLIELLRAVDPKTYGVSRVLVWGSHATLSLIEDRYWLEKKKLSALEGGFLKRSLWQRFQLSKEARESDCNLLFVPGGSYSGDFHPIVTMSQNMLPFDWHELKRFGWSLTTLRLVLLRLIQSRTFRSANGMVFLTHYAKMAVEKATGRLGCTTVIPHGISPRFLISPRPQKPIEAFSIDTPFRILYVSIIDQYKHQWHVVEAIALLRKTTGWPLRLDLIGPAYPKALKRLQNSLQQFDPEGNWVRYHGPIPFGDLHHMYARTEIGIFASSCENMPNILLENMAAGLPIACSNSMPMPEILGKASVYFDPENPQEISSALHKLISSHELRNELAHASFLASCNYTWERCTGQTFQFLVDVHQDYMKQQENLCVV